MEETVYQPAVSPVAPPEPVSPTPSVSPHDKLTHFKPKTTPKLLYLVGGVAIILLTLAIAISFFGKSKTNTKTSTSSGTSSTDIETTGFITYTNIPNFFTLAIPPKWKIVETSPDQTDTIIIETDNQALATIRSFKAAGNTVDDYLASIQDGRTTSKTSPVKIGAYDGIERTESWAKIGLQPIVTYVQIQDKMYLFTLLPSDGKNAISSESLIRDYRNMLSTFTLTSTSALGKDWKEYVTSKVDGLTFPSFSFTHPQSWAVTEKSENKNLIISIYRNNYEIKVTQAEVGGAVCLFKDSPDFQGSSGDLRSKEFTEFTTKKGSILRRYFNQNEGDKSTIFFCQKEAITPYFATPTQLGGIAYYVPAKYDLNIVKEMDEIVKTFTTSEASSSALPQ